MSNAPELLFRDTFRVRRPVWQTRRGANPHAIGHPRAKYIGNGRAVMKVHEGPESGVYHVGSVGTGEVGQVSRFEFRYGYVETRVKFNFRRQAAHAAVWLQDVMGYVPDDPSTPANERGAEIDIVEFFGKMNDNFGRIWQNVYWRKPSQGIGQFVGAQRDTWVEYPDTYHKYGVEWLPDRYVFSIDGHDVAEVTEGLSSTPKFLAMSIKVSTAKELANISPPYDDLEQVSDYIQVWSKKPR